MSQRKCGKNFEFSKRSVYHILKQKIESEKVEIKIKKSMEVNEKHANLMI